MLFGHLQEETKAMRYDEIIKLGDTLEIGEYDCYECPLCGQHNLHIRKVGIAPLGDVYAGDYKIVGSDLTNRRRDKFITIYYCEYCNYGDKNDDNCIVNAIIRIEVVHKGCLYSGIYHVGQLNTRNLKLIDVKESD